MTFNNPRVLSHTLHDKLLNMREELIAPCGMNCGLCGNYLAMQYDLKKKGFHKSYCAGCRPRGKNCTYMNEHCDLLSKGLINFCYECSNFPCRRLKALSRTGVETGHHGGRVGL